MTKLGFIRLSEYAMNIMLLDWGHEVFEYVVAQYQQFMVRR